MSTTGNFGDRCTTVDQVPRCLVLQTTVHCHSEFVLHSLRNVEPVQVRVEQLWQTTVELPRSSDETCSSIQHTLQLVAGCNSSHWALHVLFRSQTVHRKIKLFLRTNKMMMKWWKRQWRQRIVRHLKSLLTALIPLCDEISSFTYLLTYQLLISRGFLFRVTFLFPFCLLVLYF